MATKNLSCLLEKTRHNNKKGGKPGRFKNENLFADLKVSTAICFDSYTNPLIRLISLAPQKRRDIKKLHIISTGFLHHWLL